jgi:Asp-tRNA(Asn)/Glu-tRNA(Gln) amidotransferase C subunit
VYTFVVDKARLPPSPVISGDMVEHLERLSLVRFSNADAVHHLQKAIWCAHMRVNVCLYAHSYADVLSTIDTNGVSPMYTVFGDDSTADVSVPLRDDDMALTACARDCLMRMTTVNVEGVCTCTTDARAPGFVQENIM